MGHDAASPGRREPGNGVGTIAEDDVQVLDLGLDGTDRRDVETPAPSPEPPLVVSRRSARLAAVALVLVGAVIGWAVTSGPDTPGDDPSPFASDSMAPGPGTDVDGVVAPSGDGSASASVTPQRQADHLRGVVGLVASSPLDEDRPALWLIDEDGRLLARADLPLTRDARKVPLVVSSDNVFIVGDEDVYRLPAGLDGYAGVIAEHRRIVPGGRSDRVWLVDEAGSTFSSLDTNEAEIGPPFTATEALTEVWSGVDDGLLVSRSTDASPSRVSLLAPGRAPVDVGLIEPRAGATVLSTFADLALVQGPDTAVYDLGEAAYVMSPRQLGDVVDGCISPGGRFAAVVTAEGVLRGLEVRTGQTWRVADDVPADLGITWTGPDQLVYIDGGRLTAIDLPSGNAADIAVLSDGFDWRLVGSGISC